MKKLYLLFLTIVLSACGFRPLYVQHTSEANWFFDKNADTSINAEMAQIKIVTVKDRFGQEMKNHLLDSLTPKGAPKQPKYRLVLSVISRDVVQQAMRDDVTATNERITYKIGYQLFGYPSEKLLNGESMAVVSYDILSDPFSTTMSQKKAESDAAKIITDDITLRLGAYFHTIYGGTK